MHSLEKFSGNLYKIEDIINGKTSKKNVQKRLGGVWLFFEVLPFTDDASVVNGNTSKKSMHVVVLVVCVCFVFSRIFLDMKF